jgi:hypothetical protein
MESAFGRVSCVCGRVNWWGHGEVMDLLARADAAAREQMCDHQCDPRLEIVHTVNLPLTASLLQEATEAEMQALLRRDPCAYCGAAMEELDHIVPRSQGGPDGVSNRTAACSRCNREKLATPLLTYLAERVPA